VEIKMTNNNQLSVEQVNMMLQLQNDIRDSIQDYGVVDAAIDQGKGVSINFSQLEEGELMDCRNKLNDVLADRNCPVKKRQSALASLTQIEGLLDVFHIVKQYGLDPAGMNGAEVVLTASRKPIRVWNKTGLADYFVTDASHLKGGLTKAKDTTMSVTNRFANWLANKTQN
jgi:hypothetical protein